MIVKTMKSGGTRTEYLLTDVSMTPDEAIKHVESTWDSRTPAELALHAEVLRLWNMERLLQNHQLISKRSGNSTAERVRAVLDEKEIEVQFLLNAVIKRDRENNQLCNQLRKLREEDASTTK